MRILFTGKNFAQGLKESDPTNYLMAAEALGHVCVENFFERPDVVVCVDYARASRGVIKQARASGIKTVLICCEPSVVIPQHKQKRITCLFDQVIWVGRPLQPPVRWPQSWRLHVTSLRRLNKAVLVNADKWSFVPGQLYWLRAAIGSSEQRLDVAGQGWSRASFTRAMHRVYELFRTLAGFSLPSFLGMSHAMSVPLNYRGAPRDKVDFMSQYKVALVIENSRELMTEKIFDAWFAGCIPVYVGPELGVFEIPEELVVTADPSVKSIKRALDRAFEINHEDFLTRLNHFMGSPARKPWKSKDSLQYILSLIGRTANP